MLFHSYEFIFLFFPLVLIAFFAIGPRHVTAAGGALALASLLFYAWWSMAALPMLLGSIVFNFLAGRALVPHPDRAAPWRKALLVAGITANLALLSVFKYADFFVGNINSGLALLDLTPLPLLHVVLPVGISFYTFTQIAFLVDCWEGRVNETRFVHYLLFVTYFPHLVAGPVLHHAQMMPQFANPSVYRVNHQNLALGITFFTIGLAKKLLIADPLGQAADLVFDKALTADPPAALTAWVGVLSYTLQIYVDFSGYSDMAMGLSKCLGVDLPLNFMSPYKATSIVEFWRRWHISLSTFLRDYLYIPLGGNRSGKARRYLNLVVTMVLGGLWHGAAWPFVLWGAAHGVLLLINHLWNEHRPSWWRKGSSHRVASWLLTFICLCFTWVLFRADNIETAGTLYQALLGGGGWQAKPFTGMLLPFAKHNFYQALLAGLVISLAMPRSGTVASWVTGVAASSPMPTVTSVLSASAVAGLLAWSLSRLGHYSPFLYFQF